MTTERCGVAAAAALPSAPWDRGFPWRSRWACWARWGRGGRAHPGGAGASGGGWACWARWGRGGRARPGSSGVAGGGWACWRTSVVRPRAHRAAAVDVGLSADAPRPKTGPPRHGGGGSQAFAPQSCVGGRGPLGGRSASADRPTPTIAADGPPARAQVRLCHGGGRPQAVAPVRASVVIAPTTSRAARAPHGTTTHAARATSRAPTRPTRHPRAGTRRHPPSLHPCPRATTPDAATG
jgi:hypothetical protein